ncbi:MAG: glycosyltransferase family 4 protein [Caldilineaceae bacterium]
MRLAVNGWFAGQQTTGSGQYLHHLLAHLPRQRSGIEIDIFVPATTYDPAWQKSWPSLHLHALDLPPLPRQLQKVWWEQVAYPRAARSQGADVLWVPYWAAPFWQPAPVVVTVHDVIPLILPQYRGGLQNRAYTWLVSHTARRAKSVVTVSHASADAIVRTLDIPTSRVHVVYHGPSASAHAPNSSRNVEAIRAKYHLPERYFLYLGGFDVRKNVASVVRAYKRFLEMGGQGEDLVIAGALPAASGGVTVDPREVVADCGLENRVHFCGWVDEADKPILYALATAFVFPSMYEGFGMMATEAMASGTPVIAGAP